MRLTWPQARRSVATWEVFSKRVAKRKRPAHKARGAHQMDKATSTGIMIIATAAVVAGLYYFREAIVQFALALLLFVGIDALARALDKRIAWMPRWLALAFAIVFVLVCVGWLGWFVVDNIGEFTGRADEYGNRLDELIAEGHGALGLSGQAPTVSALLANANAGQLLANIARGLQAVAADTVFILIYLGFIFAAAANFSQKLDRIFNGDGERPHVGEILTEMRVAVERYLWVTTLLGAITSVVIYMALAVIGLQNPLFWAVLIFLLSFIPTIGPLIGTLLPTLVALVEFPDIGPVLAVLGSVGLAQFIVGNFVQPRITGDSLNLSALVILLSLALWGALWGIAGAFLAAPLTVLLMTILSQFDSTRWIAILLSADGKPKTFSRAAPMERIAETFP